MHKKADCDSNTKGTKGRTPEEKAWASREPFDE